MKHRVSLAIACLVAVVLGIAAVGKIFFPLEGMEVFDRVIGCLEIAVIAAVLSCYRRPSCWMLLSLMFASWCGYAFCWMQASLPCSCMGTMIEFSPVLSFSFDAVFWGISVVMSRWLGTPRSSIKWVLLGAVLAFLAGYGMACIVRA